MLASKRARMASTRAVTGPPGPHALAVPLVAAPSAALVRVGFRGPALLGK